MNELTALPKRSTAINLIVQETKQQQHVNCQINANSKIKTIFQNK